ncbi:MAG: hypothetical protein VR69_02750 [Peptococcaceae bacterium BRH_c4b]|nr:MAG: hypothetical protein VR69_02750 [Peptococcaceae bacterium BRH_c4b]
MKIGQITFCNYNYGSVLQCYATQKVLSYSGMDCVLFRRRDGKAGQIVGKILYLLDGACMCLRYPRYITKFYKLWKSSRRAALKTLSEDNLMAIDDFVKIEINSIERSYRNMLLEAKKNEYIAFISGSDQIWNGDWFIINKIHFLRFAPKHKRVAWGPSFATSSVAKYNRSKYKKYISDYKALSVRESNGVAIIKELTGREVKVVLDPVLLLTPSQWRSEYSTKDIDVLDSKYILMYFLDKPSEIAVNSINKIRQKTGFQIVAFGHRHEAYSMMDSVKYVGGSPWNFLSMIDGASYVCTDSFHALAFSLVFHSQIYVFKRQYAHNSDQSSRIESIMNMFEMNERFINNMDELKLNESIIDFKYIDQKLDRERERSVSYLTNAIKLCVSIK